MFSISKLDGFENALSLSFAVLVLALPPPHPAARPISWRQLQSVFILQAFLLLSSLPPYHLEATLSCPFIPNAGQDERDDNETLKRTNVAAC